MIHTFRSPVVATATETEDPVFAVPCIMPSDSEKSSDCSMDDGMDLTIDLSGTSLDTYANRPDNETCFFIRCLPPVPACYRHRPCSIPKKTRNSPRNTLVLDLDETLLHSSIMPLPDADLVVDINAENQHFQVFVKIRPHMKQFLELVSSWFEVIVFTASHRSYAETVLNLIDPKRKWIKHRQYRDSCVEVCGNFLKDLTVLGRDLAKTIIIDNSVYAFAYQLDNGIPIATWYDDRQDRALLDLLPILKALSSAEDVRPHISSAFRLREYILNVPPVI